MISFVFADLITLPLLLIYRKYYGTPLTLRLLAVFWAVMTVAGLATEYLFAALHLVPTGHPQTVAMEGVSLEPHHHPQHHRAGRTRRAVLALPQPGTLRRRHRLR